MKIGFFGNMNNYPFILARAFRRLGHDVRFVIHRPEPLHRPEYRYPDVSFPYPSWIREIRPLRETDFVTPNQRRREAVRTLRQCDFVVLNDLGISLARAIARPTLAMLTGSDLSFYGKRTNADEAVRGMTTRNPLKRLYGRVSWMRLAEAQRRGIRSAELFYHFPRGVAPENDRLLDEIGVHEEKRIFFMLAELEDLPYCPPPRNDVLRIFCATRLTWKKPMTRGDSPEDYKGSDVMIRGLGRFHRETGRALDIHLVRKGRHVAETFALVKKEGLSSFTTWHDEMTQADVWKEYERADLVFEQLARSMVGMAGLEAMASGRPLIANGRPEIFDPILGETSPICQATNSEEVCAQLKILATEEKVREKVGWASRAWIEKHYDPQVVAKRILQRLEAPKRGSLVPSTERDG